MSVVVIGGGVIGYSVAHALAVRGADVHIIEMRGPGCGATQASAGMLAPYIEGHSAALLQLGVASLSLYDDFISGVDSDSDQTTEYRRLGTLQVARSAAHASELRRADVALTGRAVTHSLINGDDLRRLEPALASDLSCGLLVPAHGYVHVGELIASLTRASHRRGVTPHLGRVVRLEPGSPGVRVISEQTTFNAASVVVAAGSWSGQIAMPDSAPIPVRPIRGQSIEIECPGPHLSHVVWGEACYLVPRKDGSIIVGGTVEDVGFDESSTADGIESLLTQAREILPSAAEGRVRDVRVGLRPATGDELPLIGWSSTMRGVCLATGHYRNGILLAPLTARLVADFVCGVDDPDTQWMRDAVAPKRLGA